MSAQRPAQAVAPLNRGVLTMAFGGDRYVEMAKTLGRSLQLHSPDTPRAIVTDVAETDAELRSLFPRCVTLRAELGRGVTQKLFIDEYSPFEETLFIDADSIVVRSIDPLWSLFADTPVGVVGKRISHGEWFMDVADVCEQLEVESLPQFNGGLYYIRRGATSTAVFEHARSLVDRYAELGLRSFRGGVNDEPVIAIALAMAGIDPVDDSGSAMRTPIGLQGHIDMDVLQGRCAFVKHGVTVSPAIVHFAGEWADGPLYRREGVKLRHAGSSYFRNRVIGQLCDGLSALEGVRVLVRSWTDVSCRRERRGWRQLRRQTAPGATVVLVDDAQWRAPHDLGREVVPFIERDGVYWGAPADDRTAIAELERLRAQGATHLAVGWPSFWWLEHYDGFRTHLGARYRCLGKTRSLRLFDLDTERA